jgi:putative iron-dependent peroxidase
MSKPQSAILPSPQEHARFLVLGVDHTLSAKTGQVAATTPAICEEVRRLDAEAELVCTVAFGPALWDLISPKQRPKKLHPFKAVGSPDRRAPSTGGDLLLHIVSKRTDLNAELMLRILAALGERVSVLEDVQGFRYLDERDLTGFIDGTENPTGAARAQVALIGEEDADFAGGSYVFTQRYVHDLRHWQKVPLEEQECIIGRRRADSEELPDDIRPETAHISRVVIEEHGEELEIVRHSFPYATATEAGLFFIAYTKDLEIPDKMLARMFGATGDNLHDHLMDFSRAVSGATFFAPSIEQLSSLAT